MRILLFKESWEVLKCRDKRSYVTLRERSLRLKSLGHYVRDSHLHWRAAQVSLRSE